jgi:hypothetical protein
MTNTERAQNQFRVARVGRYVGAGLLAGAAAAILNNIIYLIMIALGGFGWDPLTAVSIVIASLLPNLLAALAFFGLSRFTRRARLLVTIGVIVFILVSVLPHLGIGPPPSPALEALPDGFDLVTIPLHIVFGLTAILLLPWVVERSQVDTTK